MFPKSTHETFSNKLYQTFKTNKRFIKPKLSRTDFIISHYAGEVCLATRMVFLTKGSRMISTLCISFWHFQVNYRSDQFLDKNKDYVVPEHQDLLSASKCSFVAGLFPPVPEETSKSSKFSSIGSRFKVSLLQLLIISAFSFPIIIWLEWSVMFIFQCSSNCNNWWKL